MHLVILIPHGYAGPILEQYMTSGLTWRSLHNNMAMAIHGDPAQAVAGLCQTGELH